MQELLHFMLQVISAARLSGEAHHRAAKGDAA
jgi:hypothetical protein